MIKNGQDIDLQGGILGSALQAASWSDERRMVEKLLELGADVNLRGGTYGTALQAASARVRVEIMQMLVKKGADVNAQGGLFGNALQAAAYSGSMTAVEYLLENGANVNTEGGHWGTALQAALSKRAARIVDLLLEKGADVRRQGGIYGTALQAASRQGNGDIVEILLEKGADVNAQAGHWNTALQVASIDERAVAEKLLKHGADVNLRGGTCGTALNAAAIRKQRHTMDLLIRHGADPDAYVWVWPRSNRWNIALWWSQGTVWKPASGVIMSVCPFFCRLEAVEETLCIELNSGTTVSILLRLPRPRGIQIDSKVPCQSSNRVITRFYLDVRSKTTQLAPLDVGYRRAGSISSDRSFPRIKFQIRTQKSRGCVDRGFCSIAIPTECRQDKLR